MVSNKTVKVKGISQLEYGKAIKTKKGQKKHVWKKFETTVNDENLIGAIENEKEEYLDVGFKFQVTDVKKGPFVSKANE